MQSPDPTGAIEAELASLRAANAELTERLARLESALAASPAAPAIPAPAPAPVAAVPLPVGDGQADETDAAAGITGSRRGLLKVLAGAAGGAVAASVVAGRPAAAASGDPLLLGQTNVSEVRPTRADYTGADDSGVAFLFQAGSGESGLQTTYAAALAGWATGTTALTNGVYGYTNRPGGTGLIGNSTANDGFGVRLRGGRAALVINGNGIAAPTASTIGHEAGEIVFDQNDELWVCVADGTPGTWRKLAGPATSGAFHPISPSRVYDSRVGAYTPSGRLARNSDIVIPVQDARSDTGAITTADVVPAGATAIAYNLTVTAPQGANFLSIAPGSATGYTASALNFNGTADVANGGIVQLDENRQVKVFVGNQAGSTHVILDVTGYFL